MKAVLVIDVPDNILLGFSKANIEIKESAYLVNKDESKWKYTKPIKIEDIPLRPLVRCKDCKYNVANMEKDPLDMNDYTDIVCSYFMTDGMEPYDFCSKGEPNESRISD